MNSSCAKQTQKLEVAMCLLIVKTVTKIVTG